MSKLRTRRWIPKGAGHIAVIDQGDLAVWMRPEKPGGVTISVYFGRGIEWDSVRAEVWTVRVPAGSWLPAEVIDKIHRIRWCLDAGEDSGFQALAIERRTLPASHRGHRRLAYRRHIDRWPRKLQAATGWQGWIR